KRLAPAALVARIGAGYDDWMGRLAAACASRAVQLELAPAAGIGPAHSGAAHDHDHVHELSEETDPHFWLSPPRAIRALPAIAKALSQADPRGRAGYESRAASTALDLLALDAELAARLAPLRGAAFVSAHPAFTHFAARYGLVQAASVEPVPGREPSPRALASLIHLARDHRLRVIFTEPQFPEAAARMIARDAGLGVTLVDPIGGVDGRNTYEELLRFNAAAFLAGLGTKS
ncbi:MAG: zinc ABC transporter substrate-binding protein, partial [Acidobacteria bacterium]|nr:zinc ABC transporter substrate-binding protein [Acidobacteriota bacterium]